MRELKRLAGLLCLLLPGCRLEPYGDGGWCLLGPCGSTLRATNETGVTLVGFHHDRIDSSRAAPNGAAVGVLRVGEQVMLRLEGPGLPRVVSVDWGFSVPAVARFRPTTATSALLEGRSWGQGEPQVRVHYSDGTSVPAELWAIDTGISRIGLVEVVP